MSPTGRPSPREKRASRALGDLVNRALDPLVARQGFSESSLLMQWEAIMGARIAALCQPVRLQWPPRPKTRSPEKKEEPATLVLRVEPGFGLDVQHMSSTLIERVNTHLGWRCVGRLSIRQEPLAAKTARRAPLQNPAARAKAAAAAEGVEDDALREALIGLGERALATCEPEGSRSK